MPKIIEDEVVNRELYGGDYFIHKGKTATEEASDPRSIPNLQKYSGGNDPMGPVPEGPPKFGPKPH